MISPSSSSTPANYAADMRTGRVLTLATEIAGKLAETELEERENLQRQIQQEIWKDLDAARAWQQESEAHRAEIQQTWNDRVSAGICPF